MARFALGSGVRLGDPYIRVFDAAGAPADPGGITVTVLRPDGTTQAYPTLTKDGVGLYHLDVPPADLVQVGHYQWVATATGINGGVLGAKAFDVIDPFAPALITLGDAREALGKTAGKSSLSDDELQLHVDTATEQIEKMCGPVVPRTVTETVTVSRGRFWLSHRPSSFVSATASGVAVDVSVWPLAFDLPELIVLPSGGYGSGTLTVTYRAGLQPVPASLQLAARMLVQHLWKTQRAQSPGPQTDALDPLVDTGYGFAIPNRVAELVRPWLTLPGIA